jgi:phytoene dehydrogenase-like protein
MPARPGPRRHPPQIEIDQVAVNGGTPQLHQQLAFRPVAGLRRYSTPVADLFLASASAHPGGGVHGACGANAAAAALSLRRRARRAVDGSRLRS